MEAVCRGPFFSSPLIVSTQDQGPGLQPKKRVCRNLSKADVVSGTPAVNDFISKTDFPTRFDMPWKMAEVVSSMLSHFPLPPLLPMGQARPCNFRFLFLFLFCYVMPCSSVILRTIAAAHLVIVMFRSTIASWRRCSSFGCSSQCFGATLLAPLLFMLSLFDPALRRPFSRAAPIVLRSCASAPRSSRRRSSLLRFSACSFAPLRRSPFSRFVLRAVPVPRSGV
jgi:hypothetical protein